MKKRIQEQEKNKKTTIIITILVIIILILGILVGLLATDTISFTKINNDTKKTNTKEEDKKDNKEDKEEENKLLTNDEAKEVIKKSYNKAISDFFDAITYCGNITNTTDEESQYFYNKYGNFFIKSAQFKTFKELDNYLKQYATQKLLNENKRYKLNSTNPETGEVIPSYVEKDGYLYCNTWNKGGPGIGEYQENESTFEVNNITEKSITGKIYAAYYDKFNNINNTLTIEVEVIKENDKWLLNHYKQIDE